MVSSGRGLELSLRAAPAAPNTGRFQTRPSGSPSTGCGAAGAGTAGTRLWLQTEASRTDSAKERGTKVQAGPSPLGCIHVRTAAFWSSVAVLRNANL